MLLLIGTTCIWQNDDIYFSVDSNDSGYDEYDEEYSHIITESSSRELVQKVENDFRPVDLPELLVITGRACTRILSGYQKNKAEEAKILDSLREEGLLAKPKIKTAGGMSFEVVDAALIENKTNHDFQNSGSASLTNNGDAFITAEFIPHKTLKKLELRRGVSLIYNTLLTRILLKMPILDSWFTYLQRLWK